MPASLENSVKNLMHLRQTSLFIYRYSGKRLPFGVGGILRIQRPFEQMHKLRRPPVSLMPRGALPVAGPVISGAAVGLVFASIRFKNRMADINCVPVLPENISPQ
jgi:hypothetical protein